jgi:hypothetical protein
VADEANREGPPRLKGFTGFVAAIVGAYSAGKRGPDAIIRGILTGGFAGAMCLYVMHAWNVDREADRAMRQQQHVEQLAAQKAQHDDDLIARNKNDCIIDRLTLTVRAMYWKEKPVPLEGCK